MLMRHDVGSATVVGLDLLWSRYISISVLLFEGSRLKISSDMTTKAGWLAGIEV